MKKFFFRCFRLRMMLAVFTIFCSAPLTGQADKPLSPGDVPPDGKISDFLHFLKSSSAQNRSTDASPDGFFSIDRGFSRETALCLRVSRSGRFLAVGNLDKSISIWDVTTGREKRRIVPERGPGSKGLVTHLAFSDGDRLLAVGGQLLNDSGYAVQIYDFSSGSPIRLLEPNDGWPIVFLEFSKDGRYLAAATRRPAVCLWTAKDDFKEALLLPGEFNSLTAAAFTGAGDGLSLAILADGTRLKLYSPAARKYIAEYKPPFTLRGLAGNENALAAWGESREILLLDQALSLKNKLTVPIPPEKAFLNPDGRLFAAGARGIWLEQNGKMEPFNLAGAAEIVGAGTGKTVLYLRNDQPGLWSWDPSTGMNAQCIAASTSHVKDIGLHDGFLTLHGETFPARMAFHPEYLTFAPDKAVVTGRRTSVKTADASLICEESGPRRNPTLFLLPADGGEKRELQPVGGSFYGFVRPDLIVAQDGACSVAVYNETGRRISSLADVHGFVVDAVFDDDSLVLLDSYGVLNVYLIRDILSSAPASSFLCFYADEGGWVCWSRMGHYAAGGDGRKRLLHYRNRSGNAAADCLRAAVFSRILEKPKLISTLWRKKDYQAAYKEVPVERLYAVGGDDGYYFTSPPPGWTAYGGGSQNAIIRQFFINIFKGEFFVLSVVRMGRQAFDIDLSAMANIQLENMKNTMAGMVIHSNNDYTIRGKTGRLVRFSGNMDKKSLVGYCWFWYEQGRSYTCFHWFTRTEDADTQLMSAVTMFSLFDTFPLETDAVPAHERRSFISLPFGYEVAFAESSFTPWPEALQLASGVETGGIAGGKTAFFIIPVFTGDLSPSPEALIFAFLDSLDIRYTSKDLAHYRRIQDGALKGVEFDIAQKNRRYHFRIWENGRFAWCLGVMTKDEAGPDAAQCDEIYRIVRLNASHDQTVETHALSPRQAEAQAQLLNLMGLYMYENHQYAQSVRFFRAAAARNEKDPVILDNYLRAACRTREYAPALEYLEQHIDAFPDNLLLLSYRAFLRKQAGRKEEAAADYRTIFAKGYRNDYDCRDYLDLLWGMGKKEEAFSVAAAYQRAGSSTLVAVFEAGLWRRAGEYEKAVAILRTVIETSPYDLETSTSLAETLKEAGRHQEAVEFCKKVIEEGHPSAEIYYNKGLNELALKWYKEAKRSFEEALKLYPQSKVIAEYVDYTSRLIGEGDNSSIKREIPAVPVPTAYTQTPDSSVLAAYGGYDAYYINRVTAVAYRKNVNFTVTTYYRVKVLTPAGLKYFSTFELTFQPLDENVFVNSAEVRDADGNLRSAGAPSDYYIVDDPNALPTSGVKILNIPLPGLHTGDTIDLVVTRRRALSPAGPRFYRERLAKHFPIINNYVILSGDIDDIAWESAHIPPPQKTDAGLVWKGESRDVVMMENYSRNPDEYFGSVSLAAPSRTWEGVGLEYLETIKPKLICTNEVKKRAAGIIKGLKSTEARLDALAAYVQKNYLYKAIMFGPRAYIPNDADTIIRNQYGDCKDHSLLLHLLLEAAGIPSFLALVNGSEHVSSRLPDGDQFDHMIVFVPGIRGGVYIDATNKTYPAGRLIPPGLGERDALILDPQRPRLVRLPSYPLHAYRVVSDRRITVEKDGNAAVRERLEFRDYAGAFLRADLQSINPNRRQTEVQMHMAKADSRVRLDACVIDNMDEPSQPLVLTLSYRIEKAFKKIDGTLTAALPDVWERLGIQIIHLVKRRTPFRIYLQENFESTVRLVPPPGFGVVKTSPVAREGKKRFLKWSLKRTFAAGGLTLKFAYTLHTGTYPQEAYAEFESASSAVLADLEEQVVIKRVK